MSTVPLASYLRVFMPFLRDFFIAIAGIALAPVTHRLLHTLHVDERE
jgi:hypothetical protein